MKERGPAVLFDEVTSRALLEAATAAPSIHNSQPWQFSVAPRRIELYADARRHLRVADADGRSLLISCGAALFNLRVALEHLGFHPRVRLLPSEDPTLVASVSVDHRHSRPGLLEVLYPAIWLRRTNRHPFLSKPIPGPSLARLVEAAGQENTSLQIYHDPIEMDQLLNILECATFQERENLAHAAERADWLTVGPRGDGVPVTSLGPLPAERWTAFRDLGNGERWSRPTASFESRPTLAALSTSFDAPVDWVRAGQALQRVLLVATAADLAASFMNQPLEQPRLRPLVRPPLPGAGHTQMLMRIGYGVPVPATPRRPVAEVIRPLKGPRPACARVG